MISLTITRLLCYALRPHSTIDNHIYMRAFSVLCCLGLFQFCYGVFLCLIDTLLYTIRTSM